MDKDELLISIATSFIDKDVSNAVMFITNFDDNIFSIIFSIANDSTYIAGKTMVNVEDIEVSMDLVNENIEVNKINRSGYIDEHNNQITKNIFEEREKNYYSVIREEDKTYLECITYFSNSLEVSCETNEGYRGHNFYDDKKIDQTRITVSKEYSIMDGYPVNTTIKSFVKAYYKDKNQD